MQTTYNNMTRVPLTFGVPFGGRPVTPEWSFAYSHISFPLNMNVHHLPIFRKPVEVAREEIITRAKKKGSRFVFMIDDDVQPPLNALRLMLDAMEQHGAAAITGIYSTKADPTQPLIFREPGGGPFWHWRQGEVFEIAEAGAGCLLIDLEKLKDIPQPWFQWIDDNVDIEKGEFQMGSCSEDLHFCRLLQKHGLKMLAHGGVLCLHWNHETGRYFTLPEDSYPLRDERVARALTIPGWMAYPELVQLADWASQYERIVEVGSYQGRSTRALADNCTGMVVAFDDFKGARDSGQGLDHGAVSGAFKQNLSDYLRTGHVVMVDSDHAEPQAALDALGAPPQMVFIDGSHEYADVKRDIEFWRQHLAPGGLLCGHDSNWPGVMQALEELSSEAVIEFAPGSLWFVKAWVLTAPANQPEDVADNRLEVVEAK